MTKLKNLLIFCIATCVFASCSSLKNNSNGWTNLFDGKSLAGWKASENPSTFKVENGLLVVHGPRAHLFYDGPVLNHNFKNFELKVRVMTTPGSNS